MVLVTWLRYIIIYSNIVKVLDHHDGVIKPVIWKIELVWKLPVTEYVLLLCGYGTVTENIFPLISRKLLTGSCFALTKLSQLA